ncbi:hypothetical protein Tco_1462574, partial [Tanacetum coccineum]
MADLNIPANDALVKQVPDVAPPTRTDDQILPLSKWVPIGKSNSVLDFWDTMCFNLSTGLYSCQLDEQWFNLHKDILIDALNITPASDDNPFMDPPSSDAVIEYVNTLGYPSTLMNVSAMSVNALYQPWRVVLSMINMCLTGKTAGYDRPRHPVLSTLLQRLSHVAKYQQILDAERGKAEEGGVTESFNTTKVTKPKAAKVIKPAGNPAPKKRKLVKETSDDPLPAKRSKAGLVGKRRKAKSPLRLIDEPSDEGVPVEEPAHDDEEADIQRALELKVQGKGKEKVVEEQGANDLLTLQTLKKKNAELNLTNSETESNEEASKINARNQEKGQARPNPGVQDESQAGPNPGAQDEGQAGPNPGIKPEQIDEEFTTTAYPNVQENHKLLTKDQVILKEPASSTRTLSSLQNLDKDLNFTDQ